MKRRKRKRMNFKGKNKHQTKLLIRSCHLCGHVNESECEIERCSKCRKHFLPFSYAGMQTPLNSQQYQAIFKDISDLGEEDVIKGIGVLW